MSQICAAFIFPSTCGTHAGQSHAKLFAPQKSLGGSRSLCCLHFLHSVVCTAKGCKKCASSSRSRAIQTCSITESFKRFCFVSSFPYFCCFHFPLHTGYLSTSWCSLIYLSKILGPNCSDLMVAERKPRVYDNKSN